MVLVTRGRNRGRDGAGARGVLIRRRRVHDGNCRKDCLAEEDAEASEGGKRVESSEFKEAIAEDAETETAMGTKRNERVSSVLLVKKKCRDEVCLDTKISVWGETTEKTKKRKKSEENKTKEQTDSKSNRLLYFAL